MVFTIEPGLYFQPDDLTVPEEFRGIGVRIEDDILVTATAPRTCRRRSRARPTTSRPGCARCARASIRAAAGRPPQPGDERDRR